MKRKVYTDGNGSSAVLIDSLGHYIPADEAVQLEKKINQLNAQLEQQEKQLKTLIASLAVNTYDEAIKEIDLLRLAAGHELELQTQVEQLRDKLQLAHTFITCTDETGYMDDAGFVDAELLAVELEIAISATPAQCLAARDAEVSAKALERFAKECFGDSDRYLSNSMRKIITDWANAIRLEASELRQAAKGGE